MGVRTSKTRLKLLLVLALLPMLFSVSINSPFMLAEAANEKLPNAALPRTSWVVSASSSASEEETPDKAIDGNSATRWSTGTLQSPGQYFQIDFGESRAFDRIIADSGSAPEADDYPRGYEVYVSEDGMEWGSPVASGTGSGSITTITFAVQTARYVRIVQTGSDSVRWWSIHEIDVYEPANTTPGWRQITSPGPVARALHTAVFDANRRQAIIFGGVQAGFQPLGDLWSFSLNSETWQPIFVNGDQPRPLWASAAISDQPRDRMVLFFGFDQYVTERGSPEVWALSYETRQWSRLASGPTGRFDAAVATDGTRAWIHGGFTQFPLTPDNTLGDLWEFDLAANSWQQLPNNGAAPPPTTNANLAYYQDALYLVGGHNATMITPGTWRYDLASRQWEQLSPQGAPAVWSHHARAVDDSCGTLLLMGGDNDDLLDVPYLEALQMNSNPRYVRLPGEIPDVSRHHSAAAFDPSTRQLIVFGGWRGERQYLGDTWLYTLGSCPTSTPTLMFYDDFQDGNADGWAQDQGTWQVSQPEGESKEYRSASMVDNISTAGTANWTNYSVQGYVNMTGEDGGVALLGRLQDASHYYQVELRKDVSGTGTKKWYIWKNDGEQWTELAGGSFNFAPNTYYLLRLDMSGSTLTAQISTDYGGSFQTLGSGTDSRYTSGKIGVRSWDNFTRFDTIRVESR